MTPHPVSLAAIFATCWKNRELIWQLSKRDILGRYRGSVLGILWSFVHPLLMLTVYTFVFGVVFRARWGEGGSDGMLEFALILFAGLIVYGIFAECANRSPSLVVAQPNFVKKVVFPLEILPVVLLISALFHALVSVVVLTAVMVIVKAALPWTLVLLPVVLLPLAFFCLGIAWFLSSLGVYLRDIGHVIGVVTSALLFLSPVFFPSSALPEKVRWIVAVNPLSFPIEQVREVIIWGRSPHWAHLLIYCALSLVVMWLGFVWFQRTRRGFADVI